MTVFHARHRMSAAALVNELGGAAEVLGDPSRVIESLAPIAEVPPGGLTFCRSGGGGIAARLARVVGATVIAPIAAKADAPMLAERMTLLTVPDPRRYFIRAFNRLIAPEIVRQRGISPFASIHAEARIGEGVSVGPGALVDRGVVVGAGCTIFGGVQIYEGTQIGAGVVIQANCSIGSHGQSYERDDDGRFLLMPHFSNVVIGDGAMIGTNTTIVRGTLQDTVIGAGSIVGNNVVIGHNVEVGVRCHVGAGAILCGSSRLGDRAWISIAAVIQSVSVGAGAMVGAGAIVTRPVEAGVMVNGFPARVTAKTNDYNEVTGR